MKIVYCLNSIKGIGGIQRVTVVKANALAEIEGNIVFIIVTDNNNEIQCEELSSKVNFIHLDVNYYDDDWMPGIKSKLSQIYKKIKHKKELKKILNAIQPDVVIAVGQSEKFICRKGLVQASKPIYIRELHYATNYRVLLAKSKKERLKACIQNFIDFRVLCKKYYHAVITLTPDDKAKNWRNIENVYFVPNPVSLSADEKEINIDKNNFHKIISVGRLSYQKNYSSLIKSFSLIYEKYPKWVLEIYGEGEEKGLLIDLINSLNLNNNVFLKGYTNDVSAKFNESSFFVLSSIMEGFPMVLFEAMCYQLPIVSYNCDFGPSFIVDNFENGFLVKLNDEIELSEKMQILMSDASLIKKMGENARLKALKFSPEIIANQWMELFNSLLLKNQRRQ